MNFIKGWHSNSWVHLQRIWNASWMYRGHANLLYIIVYCLYQLVRSVFSIQFIQANLFTNSPILSQLLWIIYYTKSFTDKQMSKSSVSCSPNHSWVTLSYAPPPIPLCKLNEIKYPWWPAKPTELVLQTIQQTMLYDLTR